MLSEKIRELRKSHRISQVELAQVLCVTKQSVSNWENDNIQPSIDMLIKIAKYFSVSTDYLLDLDNKLTIDGYLKEPLTVDEQVLIYGVSKWIRENVEVE